jgi:hypothetical protein
MFTAEDCCIVLFIWVCSSRALNVASCDTKSLLGSGLVGSWSFNCAISRVRKSFSPNAPDEFAEDDELLVLLPVLLVPLVYVELVKIGAVNDDVIEATSLA